MPRYTLADLKVLAELAAAQMSPEQWEAFAVTAATIGDRYSLRNRFLMWVQDPNVSAVAGFHAWKDQGRKVRKGGKGIAILAPLTRKKDTEGETPATEGETPKQRKAYGAKVTYVFDVSQTEPITAGGETPLTAASCALPSGDELTALIASFAGDDEAEADAA